MTTETAFAPRGGALAGMPVIVPVVVLVIVLAAVPAWAQPMAPPHLLAGMMPDWLGASIAGFFTGFIPCAICLKIAEAIQGKWYRSRIAAFFAFAFMAFGLFSWGYVIYFWVWVM